MKTRGASTVALAAIALLSSCTDFVPDPGASRLETPSASDSARPTPAMQPPSPSPDHVFSVIPQEPTGPLLEGTPVTDQFDDGTYRLALAAGQDRYRAGQLIDVTATVTYLGPAETLLVRGPESGLVAFSLDNDDHSFQVSGGFTSACSRYEFSRDVPVAFPFSKLSALASADPAIPFYADYMASDELRLPAGTWTITANADIGTCGDEYHPLSASVTVEVVP